MERSTELDFFHALGAALGSFAGTDRGAALRRDPPARGGAPRLAGPPAAARRASAGAERGRGWRPAWGSLLPPGL